MKKDLIFMMIFIFLLVNLGGVKADIQTGLVSWWKLNGDFSDSIGVNSGTNYGSLFQTTGCISGQCSRFDGLNDYIRVNPSSSINLVGNSFSISVWVNFNNLSDTAADNDDVFVRKTGTNTGYQLRMINSRVLLTFYDTLGTQHYDYETKVWNSSDMNQWWHIVGVYNGTHIIHYRNGQEVDKYRCANYNLISEQSSLYLGGYNAGSATVLDGTLDEVMIWNRALNSTEIDYLSNSFDYGSASDCTENNYSQCYLNDVYWYDSCGGRGNIRYDCNSNQTCSGGVCVNPDIQTGLVAWWKLNGNANDYFGKYNGTVSGATLTSTGCKSGQCYSFDGVNDRIDTRFYPGVSNLGQSFTWTMWEKYNRFAANTGSSGNSGTAPRFYTQLDGTSGQLRAGFGNTYWTATTLGTGKVGQWVFISFVFDKGTLYTYIDGALANTHTGVTFSGNSSTSVKLGSGYSGVRWHNGSIDDVMIFNRSLSSTEILTLYNSYQTCVPESDTIFCSRLGKNCGSVTANDNCGTSRTVSSCGSCTSPESCTNNVCTCIPTTCSALNKNCGTASDGCGGTLNCGTCSTGYSCSDGICTCTPESDSTFCSRLGKNCGSVTANDNCGTSRTVSSCGSCTSPNTCQNNVCTCIPTTCSALNKNCGTASDGCGGTLNCGTCSIGYICEINGTCIKECTSHASISCYDDDVYWYNSCNVREEIKEDCNSTQTCSDGICVATCSCPDEPNLCTVDLCSNDVCHHIPIANCCISNSDCNDNKICTNNVCVNPPPSPAWQTGLVAWWKFNGNLLDSIGVNDGTNYGSTFQTTGCVSEQCSIFDGLNDYIRVNPSSSINLVGDSFSISVWVNFNNLSDTAANNDDVFVRKTGTNTGYQLRIIDSRVLLTFYDTLGTQHYDYETKVWNSSDMNQWWHIVGVYNGTHIIHYRNGQEVDEHVFTNYNLISEQSSLYLGGYNSGAATVLDGTLDEVMIWNRGLNSTEISELYNSFDYGSTPVCTENSYSQCYYNDVYWYNSCGGRGNIKEDCNSDQTCTSGACVNNPLSTGPMIIDHTNTNISNIPLSCINKVKTELLIAYQHTSHGHQITYGLDALEAHNSLYSWTDSSSITSDLTLDDTAMNTASSYDLTYEDGWAPATRTYLDSHPDTNVIMWSWCNIAGHNITKYLSNMQSLITDYPNVKFVFITGHANGGGINDSSDSQNVLIRAFVNGSSSSFCSNHNCILFDFSDMENYDPDDNYYLDKRVEDGLQYDCVAPYDSGSRTCNWTQEYMERHPDVLSSHLVNEHISGCSHSPETGESPTCELNCALKGQAAWWMFARMAGWDGVAGHEC